MKRLIPVLLLSSSLFSAAQQAPEPDLSKFYSQELLAQLPQVQQAAMKSDYALRELDHLTNNIGPRASGSPQAQAAIEYVADELRKLGLEVRLEKVMVPHWVRGTETAELVQYPGQAPNTRQKVVLTALGNSAATPPDGITAEVVVVSSFRELAALGAEKVTGRIVLFNVPFDEREAEMGLAGEAYGTVSRYRGNGGVEAVKLGAVAALVRAAGGADFRIAHTGYSAPAGIPNASVTAEDADLIARLSKEGPARMHLTLTPAKYPDVESYNVVADLKGSEHPEQVVIVSGHLDSWDLGTGAIDDAAGVVMAMETAAVFQQLKLRPKRTLRVIAWIDEELRGSGHDAYFKDHQAEIANHVAAIESDSGAGHPAGFQVAIPPDAIPLLRPVQDVLRGQGATAMRPGHTGSDIAPLSKAGVPTFGLMQDTRHYFDYHHTPADTFDKVEPQGLAENAAAMATLAWALCNTDQPLPRAK
ncbi:MAG: M20/M25/M40 family metallo-hydrolase [Acidobacteriia bacterium]|nr:M20/M25/M40 family metallo-hydrolase [Terriglobia bacterium]